jgi:hypothetical protein
MQTAAATYLAAIWTHGNVYDLIDVQCLYNSSNAVTQTKNFSPEKKKTGKRIKKQTGKNSGRSQFYNQGAGWTIARNAMIREMLILNRKISKTVQKNNEILNKLVYDPRDCPSCRASPGSKSLDEADQSAQGAAIPKADAA